MSEEKEPAVVIDIDEAVVTAAVEKALKKTIKEGTVGQFTKDELKACIYEMLHDQRMITAKNEAVASARIFMDIDGFKAHASQPFRITSEAQLTSFFENLKTVITKKTHLVMACAIVEVEQVKPLGS